MSSKKIDIEAEYRFYLKKVELKEKNMTPIQRVETKRAFMGGFSQAIITLIQNTQGDTGPEIIKQACNDLQDFWDAEEKRHNAQMKVIK